MLVLQGRIRTPVPEPPRLATPLPSPRVATPVPARPRLATPLPVSRISTKVPAPPHITTRRPPTKNRLIAQGSAVVTGSAAVHAHLGVEYAENGALVDGVAAIAIGSAASNTAAVAGSAAVRVRHNLAASNGAAVAGGAATRPRHTIAATQAIGTGDSVANVRATYRLSATQAVEVASTVIARPVVSLDAEQSIGTVGVASSVPSVGTIDVDAAQSLEVSGVATVRLRHTLPAIQTIAVVESATRDAIVVPGAGTQAIAIDGTAATRARYTLTASQTVDVAGAVRGTPTLTAAGSAAVNGAATSRPRHTLDAASSAAASGTAAVAVVMIKRQRVNLISEVSNPAANGAWGDIANWSSDATFPATVSGGKLVVVGGGTVTATVTYRMNTVANTASTVRLTVNGNPVATFADRLNDGDFVDTATITVAGGDIIDLQFKRTVAGSNSLQLPSSIDLVPA